MRPVFVMGDLHGQLEKATGHLREAALIDAELAWCGADATLCFIGDYCDRGPDGIGCVDLVMRLQRQAAASGGRVIALLGNHEPLLLGAQKFGDTDFDDLYESFWLSWKRNGGQDSDLATLTAEHFDWLRRRPAMYRIDDSLLIHADALFYLELGQSIEAINELIEEVLASDEAAAWQALFVAFSQRMDFCTRDASGIVAVNVFLNTFGAERLVHGHTPISYMTNQPAAEVTQAFIYADGRCINVDGGMYLGGPGFLHQLT